MYDIGDEAHNNFKNAVRIISSETGLYGYALLDINTSSPLIQTLLKKTCFFRLTIIYLFCFAMYDFHKNVDSIYVFKVLVKYLSFH